MMMKRGKTLALAAPGDRTLLQPGAHVFISAQQQQGDGTVTAARGLVPPM